MLFFHRIRRYFRNRSRNIFHYHDGDRWHRADPLLIGTRLEEVLPDYQEQLDILAKDRSKAPVGAVLDDLIRQQREAATKLAAAARTIFGLKPLTDADGVTDPEAIGIIARYFVFMQEVAADAALFADVPAVA